MSSFSACCYSAQRRRRREVVLSFPAAPSFPARQNSQVPFSKLPPLDHFSPFRGSGQKWAISFNTPENRKAGREVGREVHNARQQSEGGRLGLWRSGNCCMTRSAKSEGWVSVRRGVAVQSCLHTGGESRRREMRSRWFSVLLRGGRASRGSRVIGRMRRLHRYVSDIFTLWFNICAGGNHASALDLLLGICLIVHRS